MAERRDMEIICLMGMRDDFTLHNKERLRQMETNSLWQAAHFAVSEEG